MKINEILEDPNGKLSSLRVAILFWIATICFNSVYLTIVTEKLTGADSSMVTGLGILLGGKAVQSYAENKSTETLEKPKTTN